MPNYVNNTFLEFLIYVQLGSLGLRPLVSSEQSRWQMRGMLADTGQTIGQGGMFWAHQTAPVGLAIGGYTDFFLTPVVTT